jgi:hypothetical protein
MNNQKQEGTDKEESISLKDNKEVARKKKLKQIALQKINLGTKPINISPSKYYEFFDNTYIGSHIKARIKTISFIAVVIIIFIILFTLKGKFHRQDNDDENENNKLITQNTPVASNKPVSSSHTSAGNQTISSPSPTPSASSSKKE